MWRIVSPYLPLQFAWFQTLHSKISSPLLYSDTRMSTLCWKNALCHQEFLVDKFGLGDRTFGDGVASATQQPSTLRSLYHFPEMPSSVFSTKSLYTIIRYSVTWLTHLSLIQKEMSIYCSGCFCFAGNHNYSNWLLLHSLLYTNQIAT